MAKPDKPGQHQGLSSPSPIVSGRGDELVSGTVTAVRNQGLDGSRCHYEGHHLVSQEARGSKPKLPAPEPQCQCPLFGGKQGGGVAGGAGLPLQPQRDILAGSLSL